MKKRILTPAAIVLLFAVAPCWAGISVGSGGAIALGQGAIDLGGGTLSIDGVFDVADGSVSQAGDVVVNGSLSGGTGSIFLRGDWINNGSFNAGQGQVSLVDDAGTSAQFGGESVFYGLSMNSSAGGSFVLPSNLTQRVTNALTIQGASGQPLQLRASNPPQVAELVLDPGGSQNIAFVGVSDVYATGQHLAPDQTNQGGNGNDFGWFGSGIPYAVPALSFGGLVLLILAFFGVALVRRGGGV